MEAAAPKKQANESHHFQLRNKQNQKWLTNDDLYPEREDPLGDQVVLVLEEQKAHDLRFKYEQEYKQYGSDIEIEVVSFNAAGHEIGAC